MIILIKCIIKLWLCKFLTAASLTAWEEPERTHARTGQSAASLTAWEEPERTHARTGQSAASLWHYGNCCSVTKLRPTLRHPMDNSTPGSPVLQHLWVCSNSCPPSQWCHPTISSSVTPVSSCPQSFPASGSFPVSLPKIICPFRSVF